MAPMELPADKPSLRAWATGFRARLADREPPARGKALLRRLKSVQEFRDAHGVLTCVPIRGEPDIGDLLDSPPDGKCLYVPRVIDAGVGLSIHPYPAPLHPSRWGIPEPSANAPVVPEDEITRTVDVALIMGLAFAEIDLARLGYGGGFFDRFLAAHAIFAIGLAYDETIVLHGMSRWMSS